MNLEQIKFIEHYIAKVKQISKLALILCVLIITIPPLIFYFYTIYETNTFNRESLGEDRYSARMFDSALYAIIMLIVFTLMLVPLLIAVNKFLSRYIYIVSTLSDKDIDKLMQNTSKVSLLEKYTPSCIFKDNSVAIFSLFNQKNLKFIDVKHIEVKYIRHRGAHYAIFIETIHGSFNYRFPGDGVMTRALLNEAILANPNISNNRNWQY